MTIKRRKEASVKKVFMHRVADVRGGVSIAASELGDGFIYEGSVISVPDSDGICHLIKFARFTAAATNSATSYQIEKGSNLKVGDNISGKTISAIDKSHAGYDAVTLSATIGSAVAKGDMLVMTVTENGTPFALVGTTKPAEADSNLDVDAWLIGVTHDNPLPSAIASALKGIINY